MSPGRGWEVLFFFVEKWSAKQKRVETYLPLFKQALTKPATLGVAFRERGKIGPTLYSEYRYQTPHALAGT